MDNPVNLDTCFRVILIPDDISSCFAAIMILMLVYLLKYPLIVFDMILFSLPVNL